MKKLLIIFILLLCLNLYSQDKIGLVQYGHKQSMGMGAPIGVDYNAILVFNNNIAKYTFAKDSLEGSPVKEFKTVKIDKDKTHVVSKNTNTLGFQYFTDLNGKKLFSRDIGFTYVKEDLPKIEWKISTDTKKIGDYECTKANGIFRGREYTAWFAKSIPLAYGPWKLQGLPGLILEAYDTNKEVYFYFKSIKYPLEENLRIVKPKPENENKSWIGFTEYKTFLIEGHKKAIENGRLLAENYDGAGTEENEMPMSNSYIEAFDE